jgi:hypothetical protein
VQTGMRAQSPLGPPPLCRRRAPPNLKDVDIGGPLDVRITLWSSTRQLRRGTNLKLLAVVMLADSRRYAPYKLPLGVLYLLRM